MSEGITSMLDVVLRDVLAEQGFEKDAKIIHTVACQIGDGYTSGKSAAILEDSKKKLELFIKHTPTNEKEHLRFFQGMFETESAFYKYIVPEILKFQMDRNIKEPFDNIVKHYKIDKNEDLYTIVLQDLRAEGFVLRDRYIQMDEDHLLLALKTYAKLHAVSFAMKDQDPKLFDELGAKLPDALPGCLLSSGFIEGLPSGFKAFLGRYEGEYYDKCRKIADKTIAIITDIANPGTDYTVITHGDCWCNNVMYAYEDGKPTDIRLFDFQVARVASVAYDLSYFFYTIADAEVLKKLPFYLDYYYEELSKRIRELGTDPDVAFPRTVLTEHWKKYCLYGFGIAFYVVKLVLCQISEVPSRDEVYMNVGGVIVQKVANEDIYEKRMDNIFKYLVELLDS